MQNEKRKRIGIDARMYGYAQTGIGNYIRHLLEYIFENDKTNEFVIFLMPEEFDGFKIPNERVKKVKVNSKWYGWKEQLLFPLGIYKENLDLMHFTHFNSPILYFKKSIVTIHDITPYFFPGHKMKSPIRKAGFRLVFSSSVRKAKKVIAVSNSTKNDILKYFKTKKEKITVIYEGVDGQFKVTKNELALRNLAQKYNIKKPFLFYTGVWRNHKNLVGLIRAFAILRKEYALDISLVLGGKEDPYYPEVRKTWQELGVEEDIIRIGFIEQKELPLFYDAACIFVIPSFYEGFGLIGLEAMACGTPVISSDRTSLPEILGDAAIYFNPDNPQDMAEKIHMVFNDKKLYNELVEKGMKQVKKYSWDQMSQETLELYKKI
ncbi:MAG: glycosyltransferase family 1 protein [Candidatus Pacebacteria bacterium]|nr:glycosyltransferase family 1 protein [Candidatus Paceibacterota bacterium]